MLTLAEGQAGAPVRVLFRLRLIVLLFLLAATMVATPFAAFRFLQTNDLLPAVASLIASLLLAYGFLRHSGLALLVAGAPLCGLIWAHGAHTFPIRPESSILGYVAGLAAGLFIADALSSTVATGVHRADAARASFAAYLPPMMAAMLFACAPALHILLRDGAPTTSLSQALCLVSPLAAALFIVPMAGSLFRYGETYLEKASRIHERRQRFAEFLAILAEPRWALSFSGILLVFAVLFWFGAAIPALGWQSLAALIGLLALTAIVATRRWRASIAIMSAVIVSAYAGYAAAEHSALSAAIVTDMVLQAASVSFLFAAMLGWRFYLGERDGDEPDKARIRAVAYLAAPIFVSALMSIAVILLWQDRANMRLLLAVLLTGYVAVLLAMPALSGALEAIVRRRRSLDNLYRG